MKDVCAIYHRVYEHENFEKAAQMLFKSVKETEAKFPGKPRHLYLDIDGHKNDLGGWDADMYELQVEFMAFLLPFLTGATVPLVTIENSKPQRNDLPETLTIGFYDCKECGKVYNEESDAADCCELDSGGDED